MMVRRFLGTYLYETTSAEAQLLREELPEVSLRDVVFATDYEALERQLALVVSRYTQGEGMSEYKRAAVIAEAILCRINTDPDDDRAVLSRQLLRAREQLAALPPAMTWTSIAPTKPGWYWHRDQHDPRLVFVRLGGNVCDVMRLRSDGAYAWPERLNDDPKLMSGDWAGPIEPPQ